MYVTVYAKNRAWGNWLELTNGEKLNDEHTVQITILFNRKNTELYCSTGVLSEEFIRRRNLHTMLQFDDKVVRILAAQSNS
jgi:hypothetical protein